MERNLAARFRTSAKLSADDVVFPVNSEMLKRRYMQAMLLMLCTTTSKPSSHSFKLAPRVRVFHLPLLFFFL